MIKKFFLIVFAVLIAACDFVPVAVTWEDARLLPMLKAIDEIDRTALGFTPLQRSATVKLESRPRAEYDAMLHIYGDTARTIAFRKNGNSYKWIHEQETYTGPKSYKTVDGTFNEKIYVTYGVERVSGHEPNKVHVEYWGEDSRLTGQQNLTFKQLQPIISEWQLLR